MPDFARVPNMTKGNGSMKANVKGDCFIFAKWQFQILAFSVKAGEALLVHDFLAA